jgi:hypothetical protein
MKTQNTPLWATNRAGERFVVIGWTEPDYGMPNPVVVPMDGYGTSDVLAGELKYSGSEPWPAEAGVPAATQADAQTEVIRIPVDRGADDQFVSDADRARSW